MRPRAVAIAALARRRLAAALLLALLPAAAPAVLSYAVYGVLLVLMVLFLPRGLVPTVTGWWERRTAGRPPAEPVEPTPRDLADTSS